MVRLIFTAIILTLLLSTLLMAQETVYPTGYQSRSYYTPVDTSLSLGDTLTIRRTFVNSDLFDISGLYFSDNLPTDFQIVDKSMRVNGVGTTYLTKGLVYGQIVSGYNNYRWVVDSPDSIESMHHVIHPGDSVEFILQIAIDEIGDYLLPLHTTVFYGNNTGFFATADTLSIQVTLALDVDDDNDIDLLPDKHIISYAYPNPFNPEVTIQYKWQVTHDKTLQFEVFDILGRQVHHQTLISSNSEDKVSWKAADEMVSGVYFYRISSSVSSTMGKVVLLK